MNLYYEKSSVSPQLKSIRGTIHGRNIDVLASHEWRYIYACRRGPHPKIVNSPVIVEYFWYDFQKWPIPTIGQMGNHIGIVFGPALNFIKIKRNINFIRLSELAHTAWREEGHYISIVFGPIKFHVEETYVIVKRDWSSTLQAESMRTSLQRLEIGILSVSASMSLVFAGICQNYEEVIRWSLDHHISQCSTLLFTATSCNVVQHHSSLHH